jgi:hypothetical protein
VILHRRQFDPRFERCGCVELCRVLPVALAQGELTARVPRGSRKYGLHFAHSDAPGTPGATPHQHGCRCPEAAAAAVRHAVQACAQQSPPAIPS